MALGVDYDMMKKKEEENKYKYEEGLDILGSPSGVDVIVTIGRNHDSYRGMTHIIDVLRKNTIKKICGYYIRWDF